MKKQLFFTHPQRFCAIFILFLLTSISCNNKSVIQHGESTRENANRLVNESSPYLLQHAYNPVDWFPWGDEALDKAKTEDKLLVISVGYAACHWCHVMEHESFEDSVVAKIMNENFVSIKVDREERPDVDQVYMDAAYLINRRGGWPLNAIALPDGRPIYAGTYFEKENWMKVLGYFSENYKNNKAELVAQAEQITQGIRTIEKVPLRKEEAIFNTADLAPITKAWKEVVDYKEGGRTGAPKFPMPNNWEFLLNYNYYNQDKELDKAITNTLDKMAYGGIYDHLGGGFARYSTDEIWLVPHFEKMLYDNAQLLSLYAKAYQLTKNSLYKEVVYGIHEFIAREMTSEEGGFYSSLDADSDGEEGKFYVWTMAEIEQYLGEDAALFADYFNCVEKGNWEEEKNILHRKGDDVAIAAKYGLEVKEMKQKLSKAQQTLFTVRDKRIRPGLDDKILTSWNALMLKAYTDAYRVFDDTQFLDIALKSAGFIEKECLQADGRLNRNYKEGKSSINAFLDDYSLTAAAFIALYQATFEEHWLNKAKQLTDYAHTHFFDSETAMYYYTSDIDKALIARKMEIADNVIPSSNSTMAENLFVLGTYFYDKDYIKRAGQMLVNVKENLAEQAPYYSNWSQLLLHFVEEPYEVAILGDDFKTHRTLFDQHFLPNVLLLGGKKEGEMELLENKLIDGKTTIYVCKQKVCKLPVNQVDKAISLLQ